MIVACGAPFAGTAALLAWVADFLAVDFLAVDFLMMTFVPGWQAEAWVSILQHALGLHDPGGSLMLAPEARNGLEATICSRQIDVEGVVRLPGDLKPWGCHANQYGMARPELHSAWLVLDR